ncbi:MAG: moeB [Rhodocyclaceae bacterium]|nr:moeB [Rhodocyclaceae bacterium]
MTESAAVLIRIPTPLRTYTAGADMVAVSGDNVADALTALGRQHPGILERVLDERGELRPFVNVYLGSANIRSLEGLGTPLEMDDILAIIPAVAGTIPR